MQLVNLQDAAGAVQQTTRPTDAPRAILALLEVEPPLLNRFIPTVCPSTAELGDRLVLRGDRVCLLDQLLLLQTVLKPREGCHLGSADPLVRILETPAQVAGIERKQLVEGRYRVVFSARLGGTAGLSGRCLQEQLARVSSAAKLVPADDPVDAPAP